VVLLHQSHQCNFLLLLVVEEADQVVAAKVVAVQVVIVTLFQENFQVHLVLLCLRSLIFLVELL
jgi:hypothetical protein